MVEERRRLDVYDPKENLNEPQELSHAYITLCNIHRVIAKTIFKLGSKPLHSITDHENEALNKKRPIKWEIAQHVRFSQPHSPSINRNTTSIALIAAVCM